MPTVHTDPEIPALRAAYNAIAPLDHAARERVIGWLAARFTTHPAEGQAPVAHDAEAGE